MSGKEHDKKPKKNSEENSEKKDNKSENDSDNESKVKEKNILDPYINNLKSIIEKQKETISDANWELNARYNVIDRLREQKMNLEHEKDKKDMEHKHEMDKMKLEFENRLLLKEKQVKEDEERRKQIEHANNVNYANNEIRNMTKNLIDNYTIKVGSKAMKNIYE